MQTVVASVANAAAFGRQMEREAQRRRFLEAPAKAFLVNGLPWNWSIRKRHFPEFVPILDFIRALSYLFVAAKAVHAAAWMESLVKEMNYRVQGTEMFWNNPDGAEAVLQVRAAALCDDHRLVHHIQTRRGGCLTRRPKPPTASRATAQKL